MNPDAVHSRHYDTRHQDAILEAVDAVRWHRMTRKAETALWPWRRALLQGAVMGAEMDNRDLLFIDTNRPVAKALKETE